MPHVSCVVWPVVPARPRLGDRGRTRDPLACAGVSVIESVGVMVDLRSGGDV